MCLFKSVFVMSICRERGMAWQTGGRGQVFVSQMIILKGATCMIISLKTKFKNELQLSTECEEITVLTLCQ